MGSRVGGFRAQGFRVQPCFKESPDNPLGHRVSHLGLGVSAFGAFGSRHGAKLWGLRANRNTARTTFRAGD